MSLEWHFIISFTWSVTPNQSTSSVVEGLIDDVSATRRETYQAIVEQAKAIKNIPADAAFVPMFFALEQNDLGPQYASPQPDPLRREAASPDLSRDTQSATSGDASNFPS
jgi:hypothetical protein